MLTRWQSQHSPHAVNALASKCYCPCQAPETISWWSDTCWDAQDVASCLLSAIPLWGCDWGAALPEGEQPCPQHGVGVQGQAGCCNPMGLIRPTGVYGCCPGSVCCRGDADNPGILLSQCTPPGAVPLPAQLWWGGTA